MKLLIPGGAGYIGSHMVKYAQKHGHEVVVLDDFSTGHEWAVKDCEVLQVNLLDRDKLIQSLKGRYFDGVIHFGWIFNAQTGQTICLGQLHEIRQGVRIAL